MLCVHSNYDFYDITIRRHKQYHEYEYLHSVFLYKLSL